MKPYLICKPIYFCFIRFRYILFNIKKNYQVYLELIPKCIVNNDKTKFK